MGYGATTFRVTVWGDSPADIFGHFIRENEAVDAGTGVVVSGPDFGDGGVGQGGGGGRFNGVLRALNTALQEIERTIANSPTPEDEAKLLAGVKAVIEAYKQAILSGAEGGTKLDLTLALIENLMSSGAYVVFFAPLIGALIAIAVVELAAQAYMIGRGCGFDGATKLFRLMRMLRTGNSNTGEYLDLIRQLRDCMNSNGSVSALAMEAADAAETGGTEGFNSDWLNREGFTAGGAGGGGGIER